MLIAYMRNHDLHVTVYVNLSRLEQNVQQLGNNIFLCKENVLILIQI